MKILGIIILIIGLINILAAFHKETSSKVFKHKLTHAIMSIALVVMGVIFIVTSGGGDGKISVADMTDEERHTHFAEEVVGEDSVGRVISYDTGITYTIEATDNLTLKSVYKGIKIDSEKIISKLVDDGYNGDVSILWNYGDAKKAVSFTVKGGDLAEVDRNNLEEIAEDFTAHPSFTE